MDGNVAKKNVMFIELPNAIKLILYQDSFKVVNSLESAKRKHKVLGDYATLGNIYPQHRSKIDRFQGSDWPMCHGTWAPTGTSNGPLTIAV